MEDLISLITRNILGFSYSFDLNIARLFLFCVVAGIYLKMLFSIVGSQYWVKTYTQTLVFALLPAIGYLITSVISNSIALSLGMVGALSVVRFRTPVKNPLELVVYFMLITLGIVINVSPNLAFNFLILVTLVLALIEIYTYLTKGKSYEFFKESEEYVLNIVLNTELSLEGNKSYLVHESNKEDLFMYTFKSKNLTDMNKIKDSLDKDNIVSYSIDK